MKRAHIRSMLLWSGHGLAWLFLIGFAPAGSGWADCSLEQLGIAPLNDLGSGQYQGYPGGLYPNGSNARPDAHSAAGRTIAATIRPLNAQGNVDEANGKVVMISVGMSNTTQEFATGSSQAFKPRMDTDPSKSPRLIIVDGAQGGQACPEWLAPGTPVWGVLNTRLTNAGVTGPQVQVAWIKQAVKNPGSVGVFPVHAQSLKTQLAALVRELKVRFPNLKLVYVSSRTRAYINNPGALNPEPYAFEGGFSTKWLIEDQLNGVGDLNYDPDRGAVTAPWLSWGPYLWADGVAPRSDGFVWECTDTRDDFTHPSPTGVEKVASQLIAFFKTDPTTRPWFLRHGTTGQAPQVTVATQVLGKAGIPTVAFTATADDPDGQVVEYAWTFGDGGFAYGTPTPTKTFTGPEPYKATVTVTDNSGNTVTKEVVVDLQNDGAPMPTLSFLGALMLTAALAGLTHFGSRAIQRLPRRPAQ